MNYSEAINAICNTESMNFALRELLIELGRDASIADATISALESAADYDPINRIESVFERIERHLRFTAQLIDDAMTHDRDAISQLALEHSLCPLHFIDYAICFDDDDAECATIRMIFPSHDT